MKRSNWSIALYVVLIFASGLVAGALGQRLLVASNVVNASTGPRTPEQWRAKYVSEIRERLVLDTAQETKVNQVLDVTRARYNEVRERNRPEMKRIHDEQVESIRAVLSDTQKSGYTQFLLEKEAAKKARASESR